MKYSRQVAKALLEAANALLDSAIEKARPAAEAEIQESGMPGDCETESEIWARHLRAQGLKVEHHVGTWRAGEHVVDHQWLVVNGGVFDPTSWQFKELEGIDATDGEYVSYRTVTKAALSAASSVHLISEDGDEELLFEQAHDLFNSQGIHLHSNYDRFFVVIDDANDERVIATAAMCLYDDEPPSIEFSVAVAPDQQRKGLAKKLVEEVIRYTQQSSTEFGWGDDTEVEAYVANEQAMIPLLRGLGFEPSATDPKRWRRKAEVSSVAIPVDASFDVGHDYDPSADYDVVEPPKWSSMVNTVLANSKDLLEMLALKEPDVYYADFEDDSHLAKYVDGTHSKPVIVFSSQLEKEAKRQRVRLFDAIESTLYHELGHAFVDSSGMREELSEEDEEEMVEEFARTCGRGDPEFAVKMLRSTLG